MRTITLSFATLTAVLLTACGGDNTASNSTPNLASDVGVSLAQELSTLLISDKPTESSSITAVKTQVTPGADVTVRARIGGRARPFVKERASMVIADYETAEACDAMEDDHCAVPWDFCCEDPDKLAAASASVQVIDGDGKLIAANLDDIPGIDAGTYVIVTGTIADGSSAENLVINAKGLFIDSVQH